MPAPKTTAPRHPKHMGVAPSPSGFAPRIVNSSSLAANPSRLPCTIARVESIAVIDLDEDEDARRTAPPEPSGRKPGVIEFRPLKIFGDEPSSSTSAKVQPLKSAIVQPSMSAKTQSSMNTKVQPSINTKTQSSINAKNQVSIDRKMPSSINAKNQLSAVTKIQSTTITKIKSSSSTNVRLPATTTVLPSTNAAKIEQKTNTFCPIIKSVCSLTANQSVFSETKASAINEARKRTVPAANSKVPNKKIAPSTSDSNGVHPHYAPPIGDVPKVKTSNGVARRTSVSARVPKDLEIIPHNKAPLSDLKIKNGRKAAFPTETPINTTKSDAMSEDLTLSDSESDSSEKFVFKIDLLRAKNRLADKSLVDNAEQDLALKIKDSPMNKNEAKPNAKSRIGFPSSDNPIPKMTKNNGTVKSKDCSSKAAESACEVLTLSDSENESSQTTKENQSSIANRDEMASAKESEDEPSRMGSAVASTQSRNETSTSIKNDVSITFHEVPTSDSESDSNERITDSPLGFYRVATTEKRVDLNGSPREILPDVNVTATSKFNPAAAKTFYHDLTLSDDSTTDVPEPPPPDDPLKIDGNSSSEATRRSNDVNSHLAKATCSSSEKLNSKEAQETFSQFLKLCMESDNSNDMKKIVEDKLKKHYRFALPQYTASDEFVSLLKNKMEDMSKRREYLYLHIKDVLDGLKEHRGPTKDASTAGDTNKNTSGEVSDTSKQGTNDLEARIKKIENVLKKLDQAIKRLEKEEIDDNNEDHYILEHKYKERVVRLHEKLCALKGERSLKSNNVSAKCISKLSLGNGRIPHLTETIVELARRETNWFPDYHEILNSVKTCASRNQITLKNSELHSEAREIFTQIGLTLQKRRKFREYQSARDWSSLYDDAAECDPADDDPALAAALQQNRMVAKREQDVLDKFAEKERAYLSTADQADDSGNAPATASTSNVDNDGF